MIIPVFRRKEGASRVDEPLIADDSFHTVSFPRGRLVVPEIANLCRRGGEKGMDHTTTSTTSGIVRDVD